MLPAESSSHHEACQACSGCCVPQLQDMDAWHPGLALIDHVQIVSAAHLQDLYLLSARAVNSVWSVQAAG